MSNPEQIPNLIALRDDPNADPRLREMFKSAYEDSLPIDLGRIESGAIRTATIQARVVALARLVTFLAVSITVALGFWATRDREPELRSITPSSDAPEPSPPGPVEPALVPAERPDREAETIETHLPNKTESHRRLRRPRPDALADVEESAPLAPSPNRDLVEGTLLIRARRALGAHNPRAALEATREHETEFPRGRLAGERDAIAIDALRELGRYEEARRRAEQLLARDPTSPYADRARRALVHSASE